MSIDFIFSIIILIFSIIIHEVSHGYVALIQGDKTAKYAGRLTLNPLPHIDIFGSILLPILSYFSGGFIIGWAKPVPFNPYNLHNRRFGEALVAIAGPFSNIVLALFFGLLIHTGFAFFLGEAFVNISVMIVIINLTLAIFNLIPIPPLDGSKILFSIIPNDLYAIRRIFERYGFIILVFFVFFLWQYVQPIVGVLFRLITGLN